MANGYGTQNSRAYGVQNFGGYAPNAGWPPSVDHSLLRSGGLNRGKQSSNINVWELILVPWVFLVLVLVCNFLAGSSGEIFVLVLVPILLVGIIVMFVRYQYKTANNAEVVLGLLSLTAVVIGFSVGLYANVKNLREYHRLNGGASYSNVLPSEFAAGKADATTIIFTNTTRVDSDRSFGFLDARTSTMKMYCVAPISNGDPAFNRIQYFAADINCCEARSNFQCGEANDASAHGALVLPVSKSSQEGFESAVQGAAAAYGLTVGDEYVLLQWHHDPIWYQDSLRSSTVTLFLIFGGVYLMISGMIGAALMPIFGGK